MKTWYNKFKVSNLFTPNNLLNLKNSFFFFGSSILQLILSIFTTPMFSKNMSSWDFSILGYFGSFQQFFMPLFSLSLYTYYMKDFHNRTSERNNEIILNLTLFLSITNILTIFLSMSVMYFYFKIVKVHFPLLPYSIIILITSYFLIYRTFLQLKFKMEKKALNYFLLLSSYALLSILFGLLFVVKFHWGAQGRIGGVLLATIIVGIYSIKSIYKKFTFDFDIIKDALKLCYPLIFIAFLDFPVNYIDKILLERQNDVVTFGLYNIGTRMAGFLLMMGTAIYQAFEPDFYKYAGQKKYFNLFIVVIIVFGSIVFANVAFKFFSKPIINFLTSGKYTDAYKFANIVIWGNLLILFSYFLGILMVVKSKTKILLGNKVFISIVSLTIYFFFIKRWGFYGAAYGKIIIFAIYCLSLLVILFKKNLKGFIIKKTAI